MNSFKKITLWTLSLLLAAWTFVPAINSHADSYVVTESQRIVRESPPVVVQEYTPPTVIHEYSSPPVVREETIVTRPMERENRLHAWFDRHWRGDLD